MATHDSRAEATQPAHPSRRQDGGLPRPTYQAPRVVVLGSAVELVRGAGRTSFQDGRRYFRV
jgi:hypothetical protein